MLAVCMKMSEQVWKLMLMVSNLCLLQVWLDEDVELYDFAKVRPLIKKKQIMVRKIVFSPAIRVDRHIWIFCRQWCWVFKCIYSLSSSPTLFLIIMWSVMLISLYIYIYTSVYLFIFYFIFSSQVPAGLSGYKPETFSKFLALYLHGAV